MSVINNTFLNMPDLLKIMPVLKLNLQDGSVTACEYCLVLNRKNAIAMSPVILRSDHSESSLNVMKSIADLFCLLMMNSQCVLMRSNQAQLNHCLYHPFGFFYLPSHQLLTYHELLSIYQRLQYVDQLLFFVSIIMTKYEDVGSESTRIDSFTCMEQKVMSFIYNSIYSAELPQFHADDLCEVVINSLSSHRLIDGLDKHKFSIISQWLGVLFALLDKYRLIETSPLIKPIARRPSIS